MSDMMVKNSLVKVKDHPPYLGDMEGKVLLNSMARASFDPKNGEYSFKGKLVSEVTLDIANVKTVSSILSSSGFVDSELVGIGVDQGSFVQSFKLIQWLMTCRAHILGTFT